MLAFIAGNPEGTVRVRLHGNNTNGKERTPYTYALSKNDKAALIDSAAAHYLYCYNIDDPYLVDLDSYVDRLAYYVNDPMIQGLATEIHNTLNQAIIQDWNYNYPHPEAGGQTSGLDKYTLSIVFGHHDFMHFVLKGNTLASAYYPSAFNRRTGWANWLNTNTYWPLIRKCPEGGFSMTWEAYRDALSEIFNN